jgi:hypothetical protein
VSRASRSPSWNYNWVLEFDIRAFFDSVPHDLVVRAVEGLRLPAWVLLYLKRWLTAQAPGLLPHWRWEPGPGTSQQHRREQEEPGDGKTVTPGSVGAQG